MPDAYRVVRPKRRASQGRSPPERSWRRPGRPAQNSPLMFSTVSTGRRSPRSAGQERQDEELPAVHGGGRADTGDGRAGRGQRGDLLASAAAERVDQGWRPGRARRGGPRHDGLPAWLAVDTRGGESTGTGGPRRGDPVPARRAGPPPPPTGPPARGRVGERP